MCPFFHHDPHVVRRRFRAGCRSGRPAAAPVTAMPVAMASEICHDDGGAPHQDHGGACLFCHLLGATGPQEPASAGAVLLIRFVRLGRPASITLAPAAARPRPRSAPFRFWHRLNPQWRHLRAPNRNTIMKTTLLLGAAFCALALPALADITVTDLRGRTVTLEKPAEHVLLGFNCEDFLAVTGPGGESKIAALSRAPWADWRPCQWAAYTAALPVLAGLPDVGDIETGTFSIEAVIAADPDLAILAGRCAWRQRDPA